MAIVVFALFVVLLTADKGRQESAASPLIGNVAPDSEGVLADGSPVRAVAAQGQLGGAQLLHAQLRAVHPRAPRVDRVHRAAAGARQRRRRALHDRPRHRDQVDDFFAERGGDWPIVYDPDYEFSNQFGVTLVPETWIIDPSGVVRARIITEVTAEGLGALDQPAARTGAVSGALNTYLKRWPGWLALLFVVVALLAVGISQRQRAADARRTDHRAERLACPCVRARACTSRARRRCRSAS